MFILFKKMVRGGLSINAPRTLATYEDAIKALNSLQSNAAYLASKNHRNNVTAKAKKHDPSFSNTLEETRKYIERSGLSFEQLDKLSIIHVAGTKGKGSACAFAESILRAHGLRTGLYTSPHLITVRERLRINGKPLDEARFTKYFWELYETLYARREYDDDMPLYFKFLTILMFHVFTNEPIDVAIIEVGIGGEFDCTNVIRNPVCVGITSLGLEHTNLLGDKIEDIAYQKSGIFKEGTIGFTVPQPIEAMRIIENRAREKFCKLDVVPRIEDYPWPDGEPPILGIPGEFQAYNASLAVSLTFTLLNYNQFKKPAFSFEYAALALARCRWPGRAQILRDDHMDFYLDGAHTVESMKFCASWYDDATKKSTSKRVLLFNTTGERDSGKLLEILRPLEFHRVFFVPNVAGKLDTVDQINYTVTSDEKMLRCLQHRSIWGDDAICAQSVHQVIDAMRTENNRSNEKISLLITGSLHLVGAALAILDPDLTKSMESPLNTIA